MLARIRVLVRAGVVLSVAAVPAAAWAGNGTHERTPVLFDPGGSCQTVTEPPACMAVVDRSADPVFHLIYDIPYEDLDVTEDEVDDSRRHQFIGFCAQNDPRFTPPNWLSNADMDKAAEKDLVEGDPGPEDVLETSTQWADCWHRLNPDDDRREITCGQVEPGVDWDTTGLDQGAYQIFGYTWEPAFNKWSIRRGVVKVVDDPADPSAAPPAVAVSSPEIIIWEDEVATIEACADAMDGSTVDAYWILSTHDATEWTQFVTDMPVSTGAFDVEFDPPPEIAGNSVVIRVDIEDPMGRTYTAYMADTLFVLEREDGGDTGTDGGATDTGGGPTTGDGTTGGPDGGATGSGGTSAQDTDVGDACSCRTTSTFAPGALLGLCGLVAARRRRP